MSLITGRSLRFYVCIYFSDLSFYFFLLWLLAGMTHHDTREWDASVRRRRVRRV